MNALRQRAGRLALAALVAAGLGGPLSGCGVKSSPDYPEGATHPRRYPEPLPPLVEAPDAERRKPAPVYGAAGDQPRAPAPAPVSGGIYQYPNPSGFQVPPTQPLLLDR